MLLAQLLHKLHRHFKSRYAAVILSFMAAILLLSSFSNSFHLNRNSKIFPANNYNFFNNIASVIYPSKIGGSIINNYHLGAFQVKDTLIKYGRSARSLSVSLLAAPMMFNPFLRNRNTNVKWFETELNEFYDFVQNQPLLTAEQEKQCGKILKMWSQVQKAREQLAANRTSGGLELGLEITNEELAKVVGCSVRTIVKMEKYAEVSKLRMVNSNLKLVLGVVSRYRTSTIANSELIAEGTRGLARAVLKYDYSRGFRFATYATWYVHQAVADYVRWRKNPAKIPGRYLLLLRKIKQYCTDNKEAKGSMPNVAELAEALGETHYDIVKVLTMQSPVLMLGQKMQSHDSRSSSKEFSRSLEEMIPSNINPIAESDGLELRADMERLMQANLNQVERDVLRLRLGLDDGQAKAVKEVGQRFKISWKQVRIVEKSALGKLKESQEISNFVDSYKACTNA